MLTQETKLEKPGAGLPVIEGVVARYILFPFTCRRLTRVRAIDMVCELGCQSLQLVKALPEHKVNQRVLIKRFSGIEDSSRDWSTLMTIQHLWITGESMAQITERLVCGEPINTVVKIESVKPDPDRSAEYVFSGYETFLADYPNRMTSILANGDFTGFKHTHPWFGPINGHQWLCLNALHTRIHLTQIQKIIKELPL